MYLPHPRYCELVASKQACHAGYRQYVSARAEFDQIDPTIDRRRAAAEVSPTVPQFAWNAPQKGVRFGLVGGYLGTGGCERWAIDLVKAIGDRHSYIGSAYHDFGRESVEREIRFQGSLHFGPDAIRSLANNVDVLLVFTLPNFRKIVPDPECKTVFVSHGSCDWTRRCLQSGGPFNHIVAVAQAALRGCEGFPQPKTVIYNGIDQERLSGMTTTRFLPREGKINIGQVGRLSDEKNPQATIDAAVIAHKLRLPLQFAFFGTGAAPELVHEYARAKGIHDEIRWIPFQNDIRAVYGSIDVLLCPSHDEGFGLVIAEAWAKMIPVISTRVGIAAEFPDLIEPIRNPGWGWSIIDAIERLHKLKREEREWRLLTAVDHADKLFSLKKFGDNWTRFLDQFETTSRSNKIRVAHQKIEACPFRGEKVGCGCQGVRKCSANKGSKPGEATYRDCLQCVGGIES